MEKEDPVRRQLFSVGNMHGANYHRGWRGNGIAATSARVRKTFGCWGFSSDHVGPISLPHPFLFMGEEKGRGRGITVIPLFPNSSTGNMDIKMASVHKYVCGREICCTYCCTLLVEHGEASRHLKQRCIRTVFTSVKDSAGSSCRGTDPTGVRDTRHLCVWRTARDAKHQRCEFICHTSY